MIFSNMPKLSLPRDFIPNQSKVSENIREISAYFWNNDEIAKGGIETKKILPILLFTLGGLVLAKKSKTITIGTSWRE